MAVAPITATILPAAPYSGTIASPSVSMATLQALGYTWAYVTIVSTTFTDPAISIEIQVQFSYDGGVTWQTESDIVIIGGSHNKSGGPPGVGVSIGDGRPGGVYPTDARGSLVIVGGPINFALDIKLS